MIEFRPVPVLLLTASEACRVLRLDDGRDPKDALRSLARLVNGGQIRPCRVGRSNRYALAELERFVESRTARFGPEPESVGGNYS